MKHPREGAFLFRSSQQLPIIRYGPLKGFFEPKRRLSMALDSPRALLPEVQRNKDMERCAELCTEVRGQCQEQMTNTLIERLLKTQFFSFFVIGRGQAIVKFIENNNLENWLT